jgi:hypothetical protein
MRSTGKDSSTDQSGAMAIIVALLLVVLLALGALAVDYGHMAWVQSELQKAADAGALAGAKKLAPYVGSPLSPDWSSAQTAAGQVVRLNQADAQTLSECGVTPGYYRLSDKTLQSPAIIPTTADVPAIQVVVAKKTGHNGGPLPMLIAPILGLPTVDLEARAVAMLSFPSGMPVGGLFPLAAAKTIVDLYWTRNPPVSFKIGSGVSNGQWTSFKVNSNAASYIAGLIASGNPSQLNLNDNIYIQPGVKASNYGNAASAIGKTVIIPLVNASAYSSVGATPVLGFVAFKIEAVSQTSKYIQGHFDKNFNITNAAGVGRPTSGTLSTPNPPKLAFLP